jgi:hypothetical protein
MTLPIKKRLFSFDTTTTTNSTDKLVVEQGTEIKISTLDKVRIWLQGLFDLRYAPISSFLNGIGFVKVSGTTVSYDNTTYAPFNTSYYIGTTLLNLNRSSATQTLTGVNIDGNAATVTNGFYNNSSFNLGTTSIAVNRASASQNLTGINIDGYSGTVANTNLGATAMGISTFTTAANWSKPAGYQTYLSVSGSNDMPDGSSGYLAYNVIGKRDATFGGTFATLTSQNGSMWFTYMATSSDLPTWTKVQTSNSIATQNEVNAGTNFTNLITPLTLQKRNVDTSATYSSGTTGVTTSTVNGLITFTSVPTSGNSTTYTITNSYFTSIPQAQAAIINFSIKYLSSPTNTGLIIAGYFIDSSGVIYVRVYNIGTTSPASFQLYYNIIG